MARILSFSTKFPSYHPKAGQSTNFVEKLLSSWLYDLEIIKPSDEMAEYLYEYLVQKNVNPLEFFLMCEEIEEKNHTIRAGHRWKEGDYFSPRIWSGKPYQSKMIIIAPDIKIEKVWDVEIWSDSGEYVIGKPIEDTGLGLIPLCDVAKNDGLECDDFKAWFNKTPFKGQIICWNKNIQY